MGKTLIAAPQEECFAGWSKTPLYAVTSGDIGTEASAADEASRKVFELAKAWNTILFLDEADVFLTRRNNTDLVRNSFVSIFLRRIKYYKGVLILTTNRVSDFDPAFESRIRLKVYDNLTPQQRTNIWKSFLPPRKGQDGREEEWDDAVFTLLAREKVNGREIRNMVANALALAAGGGAQGRASEDRVRP